jgi:reactive intermediate/imine deaminase
MAQNEYPKAEGLAPSTGYSHIVIANPGKLAFISGQVALDPQGKLVGEGNLEAQTEQVFKNLQAALKAAGTSFDHVVKINWYIKDFKPENLAAVRAIRNKYVDPKRLPASTLVGVTSLAQPGFLIEIEAVAAIPEKGK